VNAKRKTENDKVADARLSSLSEFYRLIIPTNSLGLLAELTPDLTVLEITGLGQYSKIGVSQDFQWGKIQLSTSGNVMLNWVYDADSGPAKLAAIYSDCVKAGFGDVSISRLVYNHPMGEELHAWDATTMPKNLRLIFKSESIHPSTYAAIMADGVQPMEQMYSTLRKFRESVELPKSMKQIGLRPSYLKLLSFYPASANQLMSDYWTMTQLRERGMFVVKEIGKNTKVKDMVAEK